jgi:hypothetical protein
LATAAWTSLLAWVVVDQGGPEGLSWAALWLCLALGCLAASLLHGAGAWGLATRSLPGRRAAVAAGLLALPQLPWGPLVTVWTLWGAARDDLSPSPHAVSVALAVGGLLGATAASTVVGLGMLVLMPCGCSGPPVP